MTTNIIGGIVVCSIILGIDYLLNKPKKNDSESSENDYLE